MPAPYWTPKADRLAAVIDSETETEVLGYLVDGETGEITPAGKFDVLETPEIVHATRADAERAAEWARFVREDEARRRGPSNMIAHLRARAAGRARTDVP